jgi:hypothetical protein
VFSGTAPHALREKLTAIFEQKLSKEEATRLILAWTEEVKKSGLTCFDRSQKERVDVLR